MSKLSTLFLVFGMCMCSIHAIADVQDYDPLCPKAHPDMVVAGPHGSFYNIDYDIKGSPKHVRYEMSDKESIENHYFDREGRLIQSVEGDYSREYTYDNLAHIVSITFKVKTKKGIKITGTNSYTYFDDKNMVILKKYGEEYSNEIAPTKWTQTIASVRVAEPNGDHTCYALTAWAVRNDPDGTKYVFSKDETRYFEINRNSGSKDSYADYKEHFYDSEASADSALLGKLEDLRQTRVTKGIGSSCEYYLKEKDGDFDKFSNKTCSYDSAMSVVWQYDRKIIEAIPGMTFDSDKLPDGKWRHDVRKYSMTDNKGNWGRVDFYETTPATLTNRTGLKLTGRYKIRKIEYWE